MLYVFTVARIRRH